MVSRTTIVGVLEDRAAAERAITELQRSGFRDDQLGFATHEGQVADAPRIGEAETSVQEGAATGTAAGDLVGALASMGVAEEEARYYDRELRRGRTLVMVRPEGRYDEARRVLRRLGAYDVRDQRPRLGDEHQTGRTTRTLAEGKLTIPLREERIQIRKTRVQTGEVEIQKRVVTEEKTVRVPVRREEIVVERRPVEGHRPVEEPKRGAETARREAARIDRKGGVPAGDERASASAPHEHRWANDRCEVCGERRAA